MKLFEFDQQFYIDHINYLAGIDEAGRGPLAGPIVASAVILPNDCIIDDIKDSKKLNEKKRDNLYKIIVKNAIDIGIGIVHEKEIDKINILQATYMAMKIALGKLNKEPGLVIIDGNKGDISHYKCKYIIKGDTKSQTIAAASIVSKVTRDRIMYNYDKIYPLYGFSKHKGYGTKFHLDAISRYKSTTIHRKSFNPVSTHLPKLSFFNTINKLNMLCVQIVASGIVKKGYKIIEIKHQLFNLNIIDIIHIQNKYIVFSFIKIEDNNKEKKSNIDDFELSKDIINASKKFIFEKEFDYDIRFDVIFVSFNGSKPQISRKIKQLVN